MISIPNPTTISIRSFRLTKANNANIMLAILAFIDGLSATIVFGTFPTTTALTAVDNTKSYTALAGIWKFHSDNLQNLLAISTNRIVWFYTGKVAGTIIAEVTQAAPYTGDDLNIYNADTFSFSGELAFALTAGQITIYKIVSASRIDLYASLILAGNILAATQASEQTITITCQCSAISVKRFTCFSSTLACTTTVNVDWSTCA